MQKSRTVMALANLLKLGMARSTAYAHLRKWLRYQQTLLVHPDMDLRYRYHGPALQHCGATLYMSCHYGAYPVLIKALADASPRRTIYCCMSTQSDQHAQLLQGVATLHNITIHFILGGMALLRGLRRAQAEGAPIFVLIDLPWGSPSPSDTRHAFLDGQILAKTALFTLAERMRLPHRLLFADIEADGHVITDLGALPQRDCLRALEQRIVAHPYYFDRLFDLHKFFRNQRTHHAYLMFKVGAARYILDVDRDRCFQLPPAVHALLRQSQRRDGNFEQFDEQGATGQSAIFQQNSRRIAW
ncbi:hypothetical protein GJ699_17200 [Duganella sp. FT80W]|uniref:Lysophospholipid acyltransferase family protein n=1 Tax=Duganella guangzhouensis TaxID=2666084 RepID=A0A6I2L1J1_9BURK|nr:hypothetical protein [Duganella guangzhouensis]MRW91733.1 hypothetical protein [Duganella guangzhouensis]